MLRLKPILAICVMIAIAAIAYFSAKMGYRYGAESHHSTPVTQQQPTAKGHWHGDVWCDETHDTPEPVAQEPEPIATETEPVDTFDPDDAPSRHEWHDETIAHSNTITEPLPPGTAPQWEGAKHALAIEAYYKQLGQYESDYDKWREKDKDATDELLRRAEMLSQAMSTASELANMSDEEQYETLQKIREQLDLMHEASDQSDSVMQAEPIKPTKPGTN